MSLAEANLTTWSFRRWTAVVVLFLVGQLGLVFWLSRRPKPQPARDLATTEVRWVPTPLPKQSPVGAAAQADPTVFALPNAHGFSAAAWLTVTPFSFWMTNPPAPPRWLRPAVDEFADDFNEFVQTNLVAEEMLPDKLTPTPAQMGLPGPHLVPATVLRVEGLLSQRRLLPGQSLPQLPLIVLTNSVVRVRVDPSGRVISAALLPFPLPGPELAQADQEALKFAKSARFAPDHEALWHEGPDELRLVSGNLVFQWSRVRWEPPPIRTAQR
jgi:hypothetical protein